MIAKLTREMIEYNKADTKRIMHALKVHSLARNIGLLENLDENNQFILESAAILHDIGIKVCEEKYDDCSGKLQEKEGPLIAKPILEKLNYTQSDMDRILYLISNHHTYDNIQGMDYQILVESDFIVNLQEEKSSNEVIMNVYDKLFKTETSRNFCKNIFGL